MGRTEETPADVWDQILGSELIQKGAKSTSAYPPGVAPLRLSKEICRRQLPRVDRCLALVDQGLRQTIRALVAGEAPWPLYLWGPAGAGKTCAALCLVDYCPKAIFRSAATHCELIIRAQQGRLTWYKEGHGGSRWPDEIWNEWAAAPLSILDELGCRSAVSDHHYETVKRAIDERYGRPLVVISNLSLGNVVDVYDERISSRLAAGTVFPLAGKDRRTER